MKEAFVNIDTLIEQTKLLGDMELQAYLSSMSDAQKSEFVSSNISETIKAVDESKSSKFKELIDQVVGADNNITSASYYSVRSRDLANLTKDVDTMAVKQLNVSEINNGVARRQHEINEWSNFNKLDTLYLLQISLITLSFIASLAFLSYNDVINQTLFTFLSCTAIFIASIIIVVRWRYTNVARDGRYWHKGKFRKQEGKMNASIPSCPTV
jgi:hypothetical protein